MWLTGWWPGRRGEGDVDGEAAAGLRACLDRGRVGGGDGAGDGQAEGLTFAGPRFAAGQGSRAIEGGPVPGSGTSAAAPLWAAVIALADQYAGRHLGFVNSALYQIGRSPSYHQAFHDVTTGTNTVQIGGQTITGYQAAPGWDPVTGWGSPDAQALGPLLARYASPLIPAGGTGSARRRCPVLG